MAAKKSFPCYGLVLRETPVGREDKFLTVMSDNRGKISVYAYRRESLEKHYIRRRSAGSLQQDAD